MPELRKLSLREARVAFSIAVARLVQEAVRMGFEPALDEGKDHLTALDPTSDHMPSSLHHIGLAQDLILYKEGTYLTQTASYRRLGEFWETLHERARWGGRFGDGNHFSFEWEGRK